MGSQKSLAVRLSKLQTFITPNTSLEQYSTDSEIAAQLIHNADMLGDIEGKHIADLGAGTGILGLGALYYGASHVTLVDIDEKALSIAAQNARALNVEGITYIHAPVQPVRADVVLMNPPFGTKTVHADKEFLLVAFLSADVVYSMHLASSEEFVRSLGKEHGFALTHVWPVSFPLKQTMRQHKKKRTYIDVIMVRLQRE